MQVQAERIYGLDWLRIAAFALLILYHIGMFFVPWSWHVKTSAPLEWLELPLMAVNPWRLALLFVISGVGSRFLLLKAGGARSFARSRSVRLLLPLAAGMTIFVVPQPWAELRFAGLYSADFWQFWAQDYFRFGEFHGLILPTWSHLWFVAYLWVYTIILALASLFPCCTRAWLQRLFDETFVGWRLLAVPILYMAAARLLLFPAFGETHALFNDLYAHAVYGFAFFFGVGLAGLGRVLEAILAQWKTALKLAIGAFAVIAALNLATAGEASELELLVLRICRSVQAWAAIVGLIGFSRLYLHRDGPVLRYLTEGIFPYYITHQTIIVLAGFWLAPLRLGAGIELAIILAATVTGCATTFEYGRRINWLRPLIGLKRLQRRNSVTAAAASARPDRSGGGRIFRT